MSIKSATFVALLSVASVFALGGTKVHAQTPTDKNSTPPEVRVTIQPGDTLSKIAGDHSTTYVRVYDANTNIQDPDVIYPNDSVRIPSADEQLPDRLQPSNQVAAAPAEQQPVSAAPQQSYSPKTYSSQPQ
jgi:LysM repeat protein